jgi:hypothetical protein
MENESFLTSRGGGEATLPYGADTRRFHGDPAPLLPTYTVFHSRDFTPAGASTYSGSLRAGTYRTTKQTFSNPYDRLSATTSTFSTTRPPGTLPPVQYKSFLAEYADEYRNPQVKTETLKQLTMTHNTLKASKPTARWPPYDTKVKAW